MRGLIPYRLAGSLLSAVLLMTAATPAFADTNLGNSGIVGVHSLVDSDDKPGVTCGYKAVDAAPYNFATVLKSITVRPPRMFASSARQRVGWQFVVRREEWTEDGVSYRQTYTSPRAYATTSRNRAARFSPMSVQVAVPRDGKNDRGTQYLYGVRVVMTWYGQNGSVVGSSTHRVDWYRSKAYDLPILGTWVDDEDYPCEGWFGWLLN